MLLRPVDASGDGLPVLSYSDPLSGPEGVARLVQYRLSLLRGSVAGESRGRVLLSGGAAGRPDKHEKDQGNNARLLQIRKETFKAYIAYLFLLPWACKG